MEKRRKGHFILQDPSMDPVLFSVAMHALTSPVALRCKCVVDTWRCCHARADPVIM